MDLRVFTRRLAISAGSLLLLSAQSAPVPPASTFGSGNALYESCASADPIEKMRCLAYVDGFIGGAIGSTVADQRPRQFCPPEDTTMGGLRDTIVAGLRDMPEHRELAAYRLVLVILMRAYPCRPYF